MTESGNTPEQPATPPNPAPIVKPADPAPVGAAARKHAPSTREQSRGHEPLVEVQRWYLYTLHRACGRTAIACAAIGSLVVLGGLFIPPSGQLPVRSLLDILGGSAMVVAMLLQAGAWRRMIAGDPAHRYSSVLYFAGYLVPAIMLLAATAAAFVALQLARTGLAAALSQRPTGPFLHAAASIGLTGPLALMLAGWALAMAIGQARIESLLRRTHIARGRLPWVLIVLLCSGIGSVVILLALSTGAPVIIGGLLIALAAAATLVRAMRLRSAIGVTIREIERAEPGPAFEPVTP